MLPQAHLHESRQKAGSEVTPYSVLQALTNTRNSPEEDTYRAACLTIVKLRKEVEKAQGPNVSAHACSALLCSAQ